MTMACAACLWDRRRSRCMENAAKTETGRVSGPMHFRSAGRPPSCHPCDTIRRNGRGRSDGPRSDPPGRVATRRRRAEVQGFLSIIVPAKNEAASLPQLVDEIARAFRPLCEPRGQAPTLGGFEILVVDDGSTDDDRRASCGGSLGAYPELRPIRLASNVGQSAATAAGFRAARGEWVATLDADLQNDPADLASLWDALPGHDAALGWRAKREDVWSKRIISRWANRVRNAVLGQSIRDTGCSVRIFSRRDGPAAPDVPRVAPVLRPAAAPRGVPDRPGPGDPPPEAARHVALQPLEPLDPGGRRPVRRRLADAPADPVSGRPAPAPEEVPSPFPGPAGRRPGGLNVSGIATTLWHGRSASSARPSSPRGSWCSGSPRRRSATRSSRSRSGG